MNPDAPPIDARFAGPWPPAAELVRLELESYLGATGSDETRALPTRCAPWTVRDVTAHLAATFRRFGDCLHRGRTGDFARPFQPAEISVINADAVTSFEADPFAELPDQVHRFLDMVGDPSEPMPHQFGVIPAGLQVSFGLSELALHRDDVESARGESYRPSDEVVAALLPVWDDALMLSDPDEQDPWLRILRGSGRGPTERSGA